MKVIKAPTRVTKVAPEAWFAGTVLQDEAVTGSSPSGLRALSVSFTPGARTAWHTHPVGQTLYLLYGTGRVQMEGAEATVLNPGDTVLIPLDVKHRHGPAPDRIFNHLAISEVTDKGAGTVWMEKVADADYKVAEIDTMKNHLFVHTMRNGDGKASEGTRQVATFSCNFTGRRSNRVAAIGE
jgi:quercetin dioxygenase-like cupin family protein